MDPAALLIGLLFFFPFPSPEERDRFPPIKVVEAALEANAAYDRHLEALQGMDPAHYWKWDAKRVENDKLRGPWLTLYSIQQAGWDLDCCWHRRILSEHLLDLRDALGVRDYRMGWMPPSVPMWRFRSIDR